MPTIHKYTTPNIPSAGVYYFKTDAGINYEVRFGRKQMDILSVSIVFGVLNEEYEGEEYVLTNKGEFYSVMATIEEIIYDFRKNNPNVHTFEFAGEPIRKRDDNLAPTKRTKVYIRWAKRIFPSPDWKIIQDGNRVTIERVDSN